MVGAEMGADDTDDAFARDGVGVGVGVGEERGDDDEEEDDDDTAEEDVNASPAREGSETSLSLYWTVNGIESRKWPLRCCGESG